VPPWLLVAAGLALVVLAELLVRLYSLSAGAALLLILGAAIALALALPPLIGPSLAAGSGFIRLSLGRELAANARRSGALIAIFAIALMMAIALEGLAESTQAGFDASVAGWTQADLFALPGAPGTSLQDERFPSDVQQRLARVPGVHAVGSFSWTTLEMDGKRVNLWAWDTSDVDGIIGLDIDQGARGRDFWSALDAGQAAVTTNYARLHDISAGDVITIPTAAGRQTMRVAALVNDITYDNGIIFTSREMFRQLTRDNRLYDMLIKLAPGASASTVAKAVRAELADYPDLVVYTQPQMRAVFKQLTSSLLSAFLVFSRVLFILALLIGAATAAASLAERTPAFGLARLCGATANLLRAQVTLESAVLGGLAWAIAFPLGLLLVNVLLQSLAAQSGILPRTVLPLSLGLASLPVAIAFAIFSTWLSIRRATGGELISIIRDE
jgi:putative ABC transport system permease protein